MASMPNHKVCSIFLLIFIASRLMVTAETIMNPWRNLLPSDLSSLDIATCFHDDPESVRSASNDFGKLVHATPAAVFRPTSVDDIVSLVKFSYHLAHPFTIAPRGRGHSVSGQAMAPENGVVIEMASLNSDNYNINSINHEGNGCGGGVGRIRVCQSSSSRGYFADVGGEQLWIDVLHGCLEFGLAPLSWTDYLYLSVGGTLSNAGISGQSFRYGPQISNVYEMDVITGRGEMVTCSREMNSELFYAVLGGLGQFGIITRARIALDTAPKRVKWVRILYNDFGTFTKDQEYLISVNGDMEGGIFSGLSYVEGSFLVLKQGPPNNWRSSFFSPNDQDRIESIPTPDGIIYCLEFAKYYEPSASEDVDKELERWFEDLSFLPGFRFTRDTSFVDFLNRVRKGELELQKKGLWDIPHPWLSLFIPKSQISDFHHGIFTQILTKETSATGPVLIYPLNRKRWDDRMSAVIPEEEVFYTIGLLRSSGHEGWEALEDQNEEIVKYCHDNGIQMKQYLPRNQTVEEWSNHFGSSQWQRFQNRKTTFDPKMILSPGQMIFNRQRWD